MFTTLTRGQMTEKTNKSRTQNFLYSESLKVFETPKILNLNMLRKAKL